MTKPSSLARPSLSNTSNKSKKSKNSANKSSLKELSTAKLPSLPTKRLNRIQIVDYYPQNTKKSVLSEQLSDSEDQQSSSNGSLKNIEIADNSLFEPSLSLTTNFDDAFSPQPSTSGAPSSPSNSVTSHSQTTQSRAVYLTSDDDDDEFNIIVESSSEKEDEEDVADTVAPKKKRTRANYTAEATCKNLAEAIAFVTERNFGKTETKEIRDGWNHFYRCKAALKRSAKKCPKTYKIFQSNKEEQAIVFASDTAHDHEGIEKSKKISDEMKQFIISQRKKRMTAKNIIKSIDEVKERMFPGETTPTSKQIYYISESNNSKVSPHFISVGELANWCDKNSNIPIDEDASYILGIEHSNENETRYFRFMFSTQRLLKNSIGANTLVVDATYKVNWQGYPFVIIGTVDRSRKFHALAYGCTTNERAEDYEFFFYTLIDAVKAIHNVDLQPTVLIADGSIAIRNACSAVLPSIEVMIMCYVHVQRNVNKKLAGNKNRKSILDDIEVMHLAVNEEKFDTLASFFIKKWEKEERAFTIYFEEQWLSALKFWFVGASVYDPSDNNHIVQ